MNITGVINSTVLMPTGGNLGKPENFNAADKLESVKPGDISDDHFEYGAYIKVKGGTSVKMIAVQEVMGFGMERENEQRPNPAGNYVINLPGAVTYSDITITHLYTNDGFFLDWLTNGVTLGGSARVDMEMHFWLPGKKDNSEKKHVIFTLFDAFPVSWEIGPLNITGGQSLIEKVVITFSRMEYKSA